MSKRVNIKYILVMPGTPIAIGPKGIAMPYIFKAWWVAGFR
jgi:hypothetical protein